MCAHNLKDAGVDKSSQRLWNNTKFHILILNMETIKLQCVSSVELKHASGTTQTKTKLR